MSRLDPEVLAEVEKWKKNLANFTAQVVGRTLVFLNGSAAACRSQECNLGNLICDAMVGSRLLTSTSCWTSSLLNPLVSSGGQLHPVLRRAAVEPRQRLHL